MPRSLLEPLNFSNAWSRTGLIVLAALATALGLLAVFGGPTLALAAGLLLGLAAFVRLRGWQFLLVLVLVAWLAFQNIVISALVAWLGLPIQAAQLFTLSKEVLLAGLALLLLATGRVRRPGYTEIMFLLYLLWVVSYLPRGDFPWAARIVGLRALLLPLLLFFIGRFVPAPAGGLRTFLMVVLAVSVIVACVGWLEWLLVDAHAMAALQTANSLAKGQRLASPNPDLPGAFYSVFDVAGTPNPVWVRRMIGTYLEALSLGHALILPIIFLFYALTSGGRPLLRPRWLVAVLLILLVAAQLAAISRGAILASALGCGLVALAMPGTRWRALLVLAVAVLAVFLLPAARQFGGNTLAGQDPSGAAHVSQLSYGLQVALQHPLGFGLGQAGYANGQFALGEGEGAGESYYFSMTSQVGLIGLLLFGLGLLGVLYGLWRVARRSPSAWLSAAALVCAAALVGYSFSAIFSEAAFGLLPSGALWILAGLVLQLGLPETSPALPAPQP